MAEARLQHNDDDTTSDGAQATARPHHWDTRRGRPRRTGKAGAAGRRCFRWARPRSGWRLAWTTSESGACTSGVLYTGEGKRSLLDVEAYARETIGSSRTEMKQNYDVA